jgi:acetyl esterase
MTMIDLRPVGGFTDEGLAAVAAAPDPFAGADVPTIRAAIEARAASRPPGPAMHEVRDLTTPGGPARLYRPHAGPAPLALYLHGGGWSVGSVASFDRAVRRLAAVSGVAVLSLDYRLAPEDPWPASLDDTVATLSWLAGGPAELGPAPDALAVAGDSAGGTLAALACLRLRDTAPAQLPDLQLLIYTNADLTGEQPSMVEKASGYALTAEAVRFFAAQWVPDPARLADPEVSPLFAPDLRGLPPAVVVTAEHDPVRDGAEAYAARLRSAGVPVELRREPRMLHNFLLFDEISPGARAAADRVAHDLARHLGAHRPVAEQPGTGYGGAGQP